MQPPESGPVLKSEMINGIAERAKNASGKIQEKVKEYHLEDLSPGNQQLLLDDHKGYLAEYANGGPIEFPEAFEGWDTDDFKELYSVLYGEDAQAQLEQKTQRGQELIESIKPRAEKASDKVREKVEEHYLIAFKPSDMEMALDSIKRDIHQLIEGNAEPEIAETFKDWSPEELKELYYVLYGEEHK
jgi:hypothetical protein